MNPKYARRAITIAIATALSCTTACDDTGTPAASRTSGTSRTASPSPTAENITAKPATTIVADARSTLTHARFVHIKGSVIDKHHRLSIDLRISRTTAMGTMTVPYRGRIFPAKIRLTGGRLYMRSRRLVRAMGGPAAAAVIGDRWISAPADADARSFTKISTFADVLTIEDGDEVSKAGTTTINGIPVIKLLSGDSALYIATTGAPRPVRATPTPNLRKEGFDFSEYDVPFTVTVPPDVLDLPDDGKAA